MEQKKIKIPFLQILSNSVVDGLAKFEFDISKTVG